MRTTHLVLLTLTLALLATLATIIYVHATPNAEVSEGGTRDIRIETAAQSRPSLH